MRGIPRARQSSAASRRGSAQPKTLETCVQTAASAPSPRAFSQSSRKTPSSKSRPRAARTSAPRAWRGRVTALCSQPEITARPPGGTRERMAMFRAWVAFRVKTTFSGSGTWKSRWSAKRHSSSVSEASRAASYPPRPGEDMAARARPMARPTETGFGKLVAALSR